MLLYKTMTSSTISANASGTLHLIYKLLIDYRTEFAPSIITRDFWEAIQTFIDETSPVGFVTDLEGFKDIADDLLEALDTFIENRNWFADFKGIEFSKHITTRLRNSLDHTCHMESYENVFEDYALYLELVNAGAPEHHLAQFQFHAPAEWF